MKLAPLAASSRESGRGSGFDLRTLLDRLDLAHLRAVQAEALFGALAGKLKLDEDSREFGLLQLGLEISDRAVDDLAEMLADLRALQPDAPEVQP